MGALGNMTGKRAWVLSAGVAVALVVLAGVVLYERLGLTVQMATYLVVIALLGVASLVDVRWRTVPTVLVAALVVLWGLTVWFIPCGIVPGSIGAALSGAVGFGSTAVALDGLIGGLTIGVGMLVLTVVVEAQTGRHSFGGGDIKLLFGVGLYLGLPASLTMLLVACIIAVFFAFLSWLISSGDGGGLDADEPFMRTTLPFAPPIAIATGLSLVLGPFSLF